jgi:hypothetical protein
MPHRSSAQEIIEDRQPDAKSLIFSSLFLVNSSQKTGYFVVYGSQKFAKFRLRKVSLPLVNRWIGANWV